MISLLLLLCAVHPIVGWAPANVRLLTRWASLVSPSHAHPEHPRPDKWRSGDGGASSSSWKSLNGIWEADPSPKDLSTPPFGTTLPREILVPFPFEAALSGIRELPVHDNVWYRRNITTATGGGGRVLLNFEAVDWHTEVYLGGRHLGNHSGGYDGFSFDITDHAPAGKEVELLVGVWDPTEGSSCTHLAEQVEPYAVESLDYIHLFATSSRCACSMRSCKSNCRPPPFWNHAAKGNQPHGKQYKAAFNAKSASSKYTSTSGIWATVWLEYVPATYIADFEVVPSVSDGYADVTLTPHVVTGDGGSGGGRQNEGRRVGAAGCTVTFTLLDQGAVVGTATGLATGSVSIHLAPMPKLWTPTSPFLYNATITLSCSSKEQTEAGLPPRHDRGAIKDGAAVDTINTYVGIRSVGLASLRSPAYTGYRYPVASVLQGYPKPAASAADCAEQCIAPACAAWNYGPPPAPPAPSPPPSPPSPPSPPGTPMVGVDLHGGDLVAGGLKLNATFSINGSSAICQTMCKEYQGCLAWVIDIPNCVAPGHATFRDSLCFLKGKRAQRMPNKCRVSGILAISSNTAMNDIGKSDGSNDGIIGDVCTLQSSIPEGPIVQDAASTCGYWSTKLMLNNKPAPFLAGILSQGFWPDGEYTSADDLADIYELESEKAMGFNFIRKHIKVGPHRWYYHADRLGMMVWQDMPETIHGVGASPNFLAELEAMVKGRKNHPCIVGWDVFNEAAPPITLVGTSVNLIKQLDPHGRPVNALSGASRQQPWWNVTDVQDFHTDGPPSAPLNASLLVGTSEAHRCGCLPPTDHTWFRELKKPCYSVTEGVGCDAASATYMPWAEQEADAIKFFGLSATGYVQNRDMEGECNGLLTYDAFQKLNSTPIIQGNAMLKQVHASTWPSN